ncbi:MAG: hypothetical protein DWQ01_19000 [Planctomycetota bacterium]|nr:MAG: hypothetical protein DWQ01_19000 [Planctomycetota bacterium]
MGQHNRYEGKLVDYQPIWGTGAALVSLTPAVKAAGTLEYDEDDTEFYHGDRHVLASSGSSAAATLRSAESTETVATEAAPPTQPNPAGGQTVRTEAAPKPVGAYPHARKVGDLLFLSGVGPRQAGTDAIPGGPVRDEEGRPLDYDVAAQTRAVIDNVRTILEAAGSSLDKVLDVTVFLIDMDRDFETFNQVYREAFQDVGATRTTLAIRALPTPIAVEFKVLASAG